MIFEIIFAILVVAFVVFIFGREIYKKVKNIPSSECCSCSKRKVSWVKEYRKECNCKK